MLESSTEKRVTCGVLTTLAPRGVRWGAALAVAGSAQVVSYQSRQACQTRGGSDGGHFHGHEQAAPTPFLPDAGVAAPGTASAQRLAGRPRRARPVRGEAAESRAAQTLGLTLPSRA